MTDKEFISNIGSKLEIIKQGKPLLLAVIDTNSKRVERIFDNGLNSNNGIIGEYSTNEIYINTTTKSPKKVEPIGKYGETVFKTGEKKGQKHKTTFYQFGYSEFRKSIGKSNATVNLDLYGSFKKDLSKGSVDEPKKVSGLVYEVGVTSPLSVDKIDGNTERFGEFIPHTKNEKENFTRVLKIEIEKIMK